MAKTNPLGVRVSPDTKAAIERAAKTDMRSVSSLVEKILVDWLKVRGFLAEPVRLTRSETKWMTYDEMATALGITPESARRLVTRRKWPRKIGSDGKARIAVPAERLIR
jgi:hypothetical protein